MDFVRRHMFLITCGVVAASGLALGGVGLKGMPDVQKKMDEVEQVFKNMRILKERPVSLARIEAEEQRIELLMADRDKVFEKAKSLYGYEPLVEGLFPSGDAIKLNEFRKNYHTRMNELFTRLRAGGPAIPSEIDAWEDVIENDRAEMRTLGQDPDVLIEPEYTPAGVLTISGAKRSASARAQMAAAQRIYCYGVHFADEKPPTRISSLEFPEALRDLTSAESPFFEDVWWAQIVFWIQKDVVEAIKVVNDEAAEEARMLNLDAWVGNMPIKDVISIRCSDGYVPRDGEEYFGDPPGGFVEARPPGTPETVFTHSGSTNWYDVVQFTVKLIMDQRDIPRFVNRLCANSFHTLLRASYERVKPNRRMVGKIYGSEPVVNVVMDFETIMLGEIFLPLMPDEACDLYEINCPDRSQP